MGTACLFGPPGIGKSSLVGALKTRGIGALDLEDLYPNALRFQIPNAVQGKVLGAADLNPRRKYPNAVKVLLWMDQEHYNQRRKSRDGQDEGKATQAIHDMEAWKKNASYDVVLDISKQNLSTTATSILRLWEGYNGHL